MTKTEYPAATREAILGADDRQTETCDVPEWKLRVTVEVMAGTERERYMASLYTLRPNGKGGMELAKLNTEGSAARLVALTAVAPDGSKLFTEADVIALGNKNSTALERVNEVATRLNKLNATPEALVADLKAPPSESPGSD